MSYAGKADGRTYDIYPKSPSTPLPAVDCGKVYSKLIDGQIQLFYITDQGTEYQLTPTSAGGGVTYDFVLDEDAVSAGNVYATWAELYAVASVLPGIKRVNVKSAQMTVDAEYVITEGWDFVGMGNTPASRPRILWEDEGYFACEGAFLSFQNISLKTDLDDRRAVSFGTTSRNTLFLKSVHIEGQEGSDVYLFSRIGNDDANLFAYLYDVSENWGGIDGGCFAFYNIQGDLHLRFSSISSVGFFGGGASAALNIFVDQSTLPIFPAGTSGTGESPFDNGADSANFQWARTNRYQQAVIQFETNQSDLDLYAGDIADLLVFVPVGDPTLRIESISTVNEQRAFDCINGSGSLPFTLVHADGAADNDIWCPGGKDLVVSPYGAFRLVRDPVNNVWRVLVPDAATTYYDFVYDSGAAANSANIFNDFTALHAVASQVEGMKRVWLKTDLTIAADVTCNGGWQFEGLGGNGGIFGVRTLALDGGNIIVEGDILKFNNLIIIGQAGSIRPDGATGSCVLQFFRSTCNGDLTPVVLPIGGDCSVELNQCSTVATAGVGTFSGLSGTATITDTILADAAFTNVVSLAFYFFSGSLADSNTNDDMSNWVDFNTNATIDGNWGWNMNAHIALNPAGITLQCIEIVRNVWFTTPPATPQNLGSIAPPNSQRVSFFAVNSGPSVITLLHNSGAGIAGGQFFFPGAANKAWAVGEACLFVYDAINLRWAVK